MTPVAPPPVSVEFAHTQGGKAHTLRQKLMQLSLALTAIGMVLLMISTAAIFWLRIHTNHLTLKRTPAVVATQQVQIGLQRSLASLRGWVTLGDERFRVERMLAWTDQIAPAMADIRQLSHTWPNLEDRMRLASLAWLLVELKESQWWVEDVAQTEGNVPALHLLRQRVEPIAAELHRVINAFMIDAEVGAPAGAPTPMRVTMADFRNTFLSAENALVHFVAQGEAKWERVFTRAMRKAETLLDEMTDRLASWTPSTQEQLAYLRQEFPWYRQFAQEAIAARQSVTWNVALYRTSQETIPLTTQITQLLDTLAAQQTALMQRDIRFITLAGNSVTVLAVVLIMLMAVIAYTLASYRASQITRPIIRLSRATQELATGRLRENLPILTNDEIGTLTGAFNHMRVQLQESDAALRQANTDLNDANHELERRNEFIRATFGRYLTDDVVASLLDTPEGLQLGGEKRPVTVLMSDLRGFTSMSNRLEPEQVVAVLNRYLGSMAEVITQYKGTIDEFIGDAILVIFGAPVRYDDHAPRAVACAVAMQLAMDAVNAQNRRAGLPGIAMGIGVNTGDVVVGNIGSDKRAKYGVVGSAVNLTARIESYTVGGQILISDTTRRAVESLVTIDNHMEIEAKGVDRPITIYDVKGIGGDYDLFLPQHEAAWVLLSEALPLHYTILEGKYLKDEVVSGHIVKLSTEGAEIHSATPVAPMSNLKIQVTTPRGETIPGDLYAKAMGSLPGGQAGFTVHFTSLPPEIEAFFQPLLASGSSVSK